MASVASESKTEVSEGHALTGVRCLLAIAGTAVVIFGLLLLAGVFTPRSTISTTTKSRGSVDNIVTQTTHRAPGDALVGGALVLGTLLLLCATLLPHLQELKGPGGFSIVLVPPPPPARIDAQAIEKSATYEIERSIGSDEKASPEVLEIATATAISNASQQIVDHDAIWTSNLSRYLSALADHDPSKLTRKSTVVSDDLDLNRLIKKLIRQQMEGSHDD
jgi:hypothetical protein